MNKRTQTKVQKHLEDPYNRLRYCFEFIGEDEDMNRKCYKSRRCGSANLYYNALINNRQTLRTGNCRIETHCIIPITYNKR